MKPKKEKTFILDTNVLIHRPDAFYSFKGAEVIIPLWVFEELDSLKRDRQGRGKSARDAIRKVNELCSRGSLQDGIRLEGGGVLKVGLTHSSKVPQGMILDKMDNKIVLCALEQKEAGKEVFFVSKDINARIKATALGVKAVDYEKHKVNISSLYSGVREEVLDNEQLVSFLENGTIEWKEKLFPNQYFTLKSNEDKTIYIGRAKEDKSHIELRNSLSDPIIGIKPLNLRQSIAFDLLLDDDIPLVSLLGPAGTGKTLLALTAALYSVMVKKAYSRVLVSRPIIPMGNDIGYLPGAKQSKMSHWMQPIFDNLEQIINGAHQQNLKSIDQLINNKTLEIEALTYIRGRSLPKQYIIIDEAQNLTPHEVKTIVSRAGSGSKLILTGDPFQIDSPYLDAESNGLSYLIEVLKGQSLAGHVTLAKSERSLLAKMATELL